MKVEDALRDFVGSVDGITVLGVGEAPHSGACSVAFEVNDQTSLRNLLVKLKQIPYLHEHISVRLNKNSRPNGKHSADQSINVEYSLHLGIVESQKVLRFMEQKQNNLLHPQDPC